MKPQKIISLIVLMNMLLVSSAFSMFDDDFIIPHYEIEATEVTLGKKDQQADITYPKIATNDKKSTKESAEKNNTKTRSHTNTRKSILSSDGIKIISCATVLGILISIAITSLKNKILPTSH